MSAYWADVVPRGIYCNICERQISEEGADAERVLRHVLQQHGNGRQPSRETPFQELDFAPEPTRLLKFKGDEQKFSSVMRPDGVTYIDVRSDSSWDAIHPWPDTYYESEIQDTSEGRVDSLIARAKERTDFGEGFV